jgi:prolyl-tRNA editing enzyme YbaK/EbsC (Cys-tRNA(Pro) deacylase)
MNEGVRSFLDRAGVGYRIRAVDGPTVTAQDAAARLRVPLETIIKSIVFTDEKGSACAGDIDG